MTASLRPSSSILPILPILLGLLALQAPAQQAGQTDPTAPLTAPSGLAPVVATGSPGAAPVPAPSSPSVPVDPAGPELKQAYSLVMKKDLDGALTITNEAVKENPKSFAALSLRGMIYSQKKQWASAEADFSAALAMDPRNMVVKFNLGEIKFVQKQYDQARQRFQVLTSDPAMGDFASYKVFLCDLFGGHEDEAAKELAVFNAAGWNPSYYFSNAAWDLVHKKTEEARGWLVSASRIYPQNKNSFYAASLRDLGYLPLPPAPQPQ